ncbi:hypothetical protein VFMJ11_0169 [Aliivibrio fischeri MJ11]|uniref:Uncharacterized protein n=1 Tax=Aliivibrio fischeri (strain MJ11) TaxID=388396 RepID=B5FFV3_ALIFM|nr:hypothetical protein VFMJ11_0169 [Aliivibrio fischeri MJ11]
MQFSTNAEESDISIDNNVIDGDIQALQQTKLSASLDDPIAI